MTELGNDRSADAGEAGFVLGDWIVRPGLNQLSRGDAQLVTDEHRIYFRDVYDHMFRIVETIDVQRDSMSGTMEAYLSVLANRTNEIMRVLTVFSALILPMTLVAGIYGMNFQHMPELRWILGYPFALGLMAVIAIALLVFFRRKGWIGQPHGRRGDGMSS